jgi:hypothetical protein
LIKSRKVRTSCTFLALAVFFGIALPAAAGEDLPFKGIAIAQIVAAQPGPDGIEVTVNATGLASHLGQFTRTEMAVVHADFSVTGWVDIVAANGDHLRADIDGAFINPTDVAGSYIITGGTGRFANAEGAAPFLAESPDGINYTVHFNGTIDF